MKFFLEIWESNFLDVLVCVNDVDRLVFEVIVQIFYEVVFSEVDFGGLLIIFLMGFMLLVFSEIWFRQGYDVDVNIFFVLCNVINCDIDVLGLLYRVCVFLGFMLVVCWVGSFSFVDIQLSRNLQVIVDREYFNSLFWVFYVGGFF